MRRRVVYHGRVQGVGFRATARRIANAVSVSGWVRNEPDGSVMMEVQGSAGQIEECLQGIADAMGRNIRSCDWLDVPEQQPEPGFEVRS